MGRMARKKYLLSFILVIAAIIYFTFAFETTVISQIIQGLDSTGPVQISYKPVSDNELTHDNGFPKGCTWKCYLRQNEDLFKTLKWKKSIALDHYNKFGKLVGRSCHCQVLLLPGPHKAVSTTLQQIAFDYSNMSEMNTWRFIGSNVKSFARFPIAYIHANNTASYYDTKKRFLNEINIDYNEGYNLIIASEEIDQIVHDKNVPLLDEILRLLPQTVRDNKDLTLSAMVVYRSPRVDHLHSFYKEIMLQQLEGKLNFREFFNTRVLETDIRTIDTMKLTDRLVKQRLKVKILDMSGVAANHPQIDYFSIMGCDLMGLPCDLNEEGEKIPLLITQIKRKEKVTEILNMFKTPANVRNVKNDSVNEDEVQQIETLMKQYDCGFADMILDTSNNVQIMYGQDLMVNLEECKDKDTGGDPMSISELIISMRKVLGYPTEMPKMFY